MKTKYVSSKSVILYTFLLCLFTSGTAFSQVEDSLKNIAPTVSFSGFVDIFYTYDFNRPISTEYRQPFFFNYNRHSEFNINLGLLKLGLEHEKYRGNLAIQNGTYAEDNYAAEQDLLKHIFEANVGISLNKHNTLWLDAGIFSSHIGFESAISIDNPTLTRSILAENSPYFLSGAKLSYEPNDSWLIAAIIANGWQRIRRVKGNSLPSIGTQVSYRNTGNILFNWSTFIGTDDPDAVRRMRYFNNLYSQFSLSDNITLTAGFDIGFEQKIKESSSYYSWFSPILITQYKINKQWAMSLRAEHYSDEDAVIISNLSQDQFKVTGFSANIDYNPIQNLSCRLEGRWLQSPNNIFQKENGFVNTNTFITASMALKINS